MVQIITDSASEFRQADEQAWKIKVVPMQIQIGDTTYRDGVDLTPEEFYEKLANESALPTTSQISPYEFGQVFEEGPI